MKFRFKFCNWPCFPDPCFCWSGSQCFRRSVFAADIQKPAERKPSLQILRCCSQTLLLRFCRSKIWLPANTTFAGSRESSLLRCQSCNRKVCTWKDFQHWYNITACGKQANQTGCLLTVQSYLLWEQKDCNIPSSTVEVHTGLYFSERTKKDLGTAHLCLNVPDSTWHCQLSGFRKPILFFQ